MLAEGVVVVGIGVGASEFVTDVGVNPLAALDFEATAGGEGESVAGGGLTVQVGFFLVMPHGPAGFAAQEEEGIFTQADIERVSGGDGEEEEVLVSSGIVPAAVAVAPLGGGIDSEFVADGRVFVAIQFQTAAEAPGIGRVFGADGVEALQPPVGLPVCRGESAGGRGGQVVRGGTGGGAEGEQVEGDFLHGPSCLAQVGRGCKLLALTVGVAILFLSEVAF